MTKRHLYSSILVVFPLLCRGFSATAQGSGMPEMQAKFERITADSVAADAAADKTLDSLSKVMETLSGRIATENSALAELKDGISGISMTASVQEEARDSAVWRSHNAIKISTNAVTSAKTALDLARANSIQAASPSAATAMVQRAQAVLDSVAGLQQAARNDSITVEAQKSFLVSQARFVLQRKQDELKARSGLVERMTAELSKAKSDSGSIVHDKLQQQDLYRQMHQELDRIARREDQSVAESETRRAALSESAVQKPAEPTQDEAQIAQDQLTKIYELIDKGNSAAARRTFIANRESLKANLIPDAFVAIKTTIDGLEPSAEASRAPAVVATAAQPDPESDMPRKEALVFIASVPPAASIFMDGRLVGKANVGYVKVTSGKHIMQFLKGDMNCTMQMSFFEGTNPAQVVRLPCLTVQ
jgi:hypothetical protein